MNDKSRRQFDGDVSLSEDDSPFLSMADFFSLISLTVIYVVIAFSPQSPLANGAIEVISGVSVAAGPASEIDNEVAYVSIVPAANEPLVRVMPSGNGTIHERLVANDPQNIISTIEWVQSTLFSSSTPKRVVFYMGVSDSSSHAHYLLNELIRITRLKADVSFVFLDAVDRRQ